MYRHMYVGNKCIESMHAEIRLFPIVCLYEDNEAVTVMNVNHLIMIEITDKVPALDVQR